MRLCFVSVCSFVCSVWIGGVFFFLFMGRCRWSFLWGVWVFWMSLSVFLLLFGLGFCLAVAVSWFHVLFAGFVFVCCGDGRFLRVDCLYSLFLFLRILFFSLFFCGAVTFCVVVLDCGRLAFFGFFFCCGVGCLGLFCWILLFGLCGFLVLWFAECLLLFLVFCFFGCALVGWCGIVHVVVAVVVSGVCGRFVVWGCPCGSLDVCGLRLPACWFLNVSLGCVGFPGLCF